METTILLFLAHYWWVFLIAIVLAQFAKAPDGVDEALDEFKPHNSLGDAKLRSILNRYLSIPTATN